MKIMSKFRTVLKLLKSGDSGALWGLARDRALAPFTKTRTVNVLGVSYRMYVTTDEERSLTQDRREHRLIAFTPPGHLRCALDIGANVGMHTLFYSAIAEHVIAFEPGPSNFSRLSENIRLNGRTNVSLRNIALSDHTEMVDFMDGGVIQTGTLLTGAQHARNFRRIRVQANRLDDLDIPPPDLVKIDCEGAELLVLRGARSTLERYRPLILIEVHPSMGISETEVMQLIEQIGYDISVIHKGAEMHYICTPKLAAIA